MTHQRCCAPLSSGKGCVDILPKRTAETRSEPQVKASTVIVSHFKFHNIFRLQLWPVKLSHFELHFFGENKRVCFFVVFHYTFQKCSYAVTAYSETKWRDAEKELQNKTSWSWVVEPSGLTLKTITLKWQQDSEAFAGLLGHPLVLFCMMLPCVLIYCSLMHYMHFCGYVCFWNNALLACIICIQYTVPWKSICCLSDFVLFVYMSHLKVLDPQHILIIDKYNPKKYKVLFLNGDFMF